MSRRPSLQLGISVGSGVGLGTWFENAAAYYHVPLPPGTGAVLAAGVTGLVHYLQGHGRSSAAPKEPKS